MIIMMIMRRMIVTVMLLIASAGYWVVSGPQMCLWTFASWQWMFINYSASIVVRLWIQHFYVKLWYLSSKLAVYSARGVSVFIVKVRMSVWCHGK